MPTFRRHLTSVVAVLAAVTAALAVSIVVSPGGGRTVEAVDDGFLGAGGEFHQLTPARILDSRKVGTALDVAPAGIKPTGKGGNVVFDVPIVGVGGLSAFVDADRDGFDDNILAVVATVAVILPTQPGHLTMFPKGETEGETAVLNYQPGQVVTNTAILRPGRDGKASVHLFTQAAGVAHMTIDVTGWFSTSAYGERGARVVPIEPTRIYDTNQAGGNLRGTRRVNLQIRGVKDADTGTIQVVPPGTDVVGVVVNLTGVNEFPGSRQTHLSMVPDPFDVSDPDDWPSTTSINLAPGQTRANVSIVPVGADGKIRLFSRQGEVRVVVDVAAYLVERHDDTRAGRVIPLVSPFRAFDTRRAEFYGQPLGPARAEDFSFEAFANDVEVGGGWVGPQSALFGNLTAVGLERQYSWAPVKSHMSAYPTPTDGSTEPPNIANLNFGEGEAVPNLALLNYGGGDAEPNRIRFFNLAGYVDYLLDVYAIVLADD